MLKEISLKKKIIISFPFYYNAVIKVSRTKEGNAKDVDNEKRMKSRTNKCQQKRKRERPRERKGSKNKADQNERERCETREENGKGRNVMPAK